MAARRPDHARRAMEEHAVRHGIQASAELAVVLAGAALAVIRGANDVNTGHPWSATVVTSEPAPR